MKQEIDCTAVYIGRYFDYDYDGGFSKILFVAFSEYEAFAEMYNLYPENMPDTMPEFNKDWYVTFDLGEYGAVGRIDKFVL